MFAKHLQFIAQQTCYSKSFFLDNFPKDGPGQTKGLLTEPLARARGGGGGAKTRESERQKFFTPRTIIQS